MFSVLISVFKGERVDFFIKAMESVFNQTLKSDEIILIRDGEVYEELQGVIDGYVASSNRLTYAINAFSYPACASIFGDYFTSVTNQLLSSGQPLIQLDIDVGGGGLTPSHSRT